MPKTPKSDEVIVAFELHDACNTLAVIQEAMSDASYSEVARAGFDRIEAQLKEAIAVARKRAGRPTASLIDPGLRLGGGTATPMSEPNAQRMPRSKTEKALGLRDCDQGIEALAADGLHSKTRPSKKGRSTSKGKKTTKKG